MAKGMTKTVLVRTMAEKLELTNKQAAAGLELLAELAVKETKKNGEFTIPGIGKLVKEISQRFALAAPLVDFLNAGILAGTAKAKKYGESEFLVD